MEPLCTLSECRRSVRYGCDRPRDFRILDLNCLAPSLCDEKYLNHDPMVMREDTRNRNILNEIHHRTPDIITLQEIEEAQYTFLLEQLSEYHGHHVLHAGWRRDGIACFFRRSMFELLEAETIHFKPASRQDTFLRGQILVLLHRSSGNKLLLANCHLVFNFSKTALKIAQIFQLLQSLHSLQLRHAPLRRNITTGIANLKVEVFVPGENPLPPVILCGDFNLTPISALYSLITTGVLNESIISVAAEEMHYMYQGQEDITQALYSLEDPAKSPTLTKVEGATLKVNATKRHRGRLLSGQALMFAAHMSFAELRKTVGYEKALQTLEMLQTSQTVWERHSELGQGSLSMSLPTHPVPPFVVMSDEPKESTSHTSRLFFRWIELQASFLDRNTFCKSLVLVKPHAPGSVNNLTDKTLLEACGLDESGLRQMQQHMMRGDYFCLPLILTSATALPDRDRPQDIVTEPLFTVYQGRQKGTVDYIFYTFESLQLVEHLTLPPEVTTAEYGSIPNQGWPLSDHFSLMADFRFRGEEAKFQYIRIEVVNALPEDHEASSDIPIDGIIDQKWHPHQVMVDQAHEKRKMWAEEMCNYSVSAPAHE